MKNLTSDAFTAAALNKIFDTRTFNDPAYYGYQASSTANSRPFDGVNDEMFAAADRAVVGIPGYINIAFMTNMI